eukprot:699349-Prymnesium_polylepis.1
MRKLSDADRTRFGALLAPSVQLTCGSEPPVETEVLVRGHVEVEAAILAALPALGAFVIPFAGPPPSQQDQVRVEQARRARAGLPALRLLNSHHNAPLTAEVPRWQSNSR